MTPERFSTLLDAYGGDPKRWPAPERDAALAFLANTPSARIMVADALRLDALLDRLEPATATLDAEHIAALAARTAQDKPAVVVPFRPKQRRPRPVWAWARAGALAAAGIAGLIVGMGNVTDTASRNTGSALDLYDAVQVEESSW
jgi:hypothetical protein